MNKLKTTLLTALLIAIAATNSLQAKITFIDTNNATEFSKKGLEILSEKSIEAQFYYKNDISHIIVYQKFDDDELRGIIIWIRGMGKFLNPFGIFEVESVINSAVNDTNNIVFSIVSRKHLAVDPETGEYMKFKDGRIAPEYWCDVYVNGNNFARDLIRREIVQKQTEKERLALPAKIKKAAKDFENSLKQ